ncbi:DUF3368 domain-containing protein [Treponema endosymbiont of Eucomonympha sp.]|uniref:DUF3368 domain-containing protein n=1 Tax=Treponema endosymbiont of Eucomonympha sp. TaxID=1580831 RepID=UPI000784C7A4|nr:DUF3368 domain-containing protein [Treponema endosymbiont of Eucomonympha sp.]
MHALKVVSDTTPILSLIKIDKVHLLHELYGTVIVPHAAYLEIEAGKSKDYYYADLHTIDCIHVEKISSLPRPPSPFGLNAGEAETIILACEQSADLVIIDEKCGRRYAKQKNLPVTGTIGILLKAKQQGFIDAVRPLLNELNRKHSWLSDSLVKKALMLADELTDG